jgi:hypothetical protein
MLNLTPSRGLRRPHVIHIALVAVLLTGCKLLPGGQANPTPAPATPATATPGPSATPIATAVAIEHATGAKDVILRIEMGGGLVPVEFFATQIPQFTLYGNGVVVFRPTPDTSGNSYGDPLPAMVTGTLSEDAVQRLLAFALDDGRLRGAKDHYENMQIADASTTLFNINADGLQKVVSAYALTETVPDGPDAADRRALGALSKRLLDFDSDPLSAELTDQKPYDPDAYRVTMYDQISGVEPAGKPLAWPWADLEPADFPAGSDEPGRVKVLDREHVAKLLPVPNGGQMALWVKTADGKLYDFAVRPLLPDEI